MRAKPNGTELTLLRELGVISDRVRALRASDTTPDIQQVKSLEAESRTKWDQLRAERAGVFDGDRSVTNRGSRYR